MLRQKSAEERQNRLNIANLLPILLQGSETQCTAERMAFLRDHTPTPVKRSMITGSRACIILTLCILIVFQGSAQQATQTQALENADPCGYPDTSALSYKMAASGQWGYGYDSLRADLVRWSTSPFVHVDSIGASVQNRALYVLTIEDTAPPPLPRRRVWIHARTHPNEVQGTWVTNQIIKSLISDVALARRLRDSCVFNIMPMYNPDGVELGNPRENAHGIDIESNWAEIPGEQEVQVLRAEFIRLMATSNPIRLALNMHSAYDCTRYFVYHAASGTSPVYAAQEQRFIAYVSNHFLGGFQPWDYFVSWTSGAPTYYPESWFWYNCHESVLALTYEDMNCPAAGEFEIAAKAILAGVWEFLFPPTSVASNEVPPRDFELAQNYPNPFNPETNIEYQISRIENVKLAVYDLLGREVATLVNEKKPAGSYTLRFDGSSLASGVYFVRLRAGSEMRVIKMGLVR
jgi:hypothetical protein